MIRKLLMIVVAILILAWTPTTTTGLDGTWKTICEEDVKGYSTVTFKVHNTGSTNPFTACQVQTWTGPATTDWSVITVSWSTACATLAKNTATWFTLDGQAHEKIRVQAQSTLGTDAYCRPYGNR